MEYSTLVLFANRFEDLPISQRVGDIIRIHRAQVSNYNNKKQFTANIFFNSSWALFSPLASEGKNQFSPIMFSGNKLRFESKETKIIKQLRTWISTSFKNNRMLSNEFITELSNLNQYQQDNQHFDFDLMVKVI